MSPSYIHLVSAWEVSVPICVRDWGVHGCMATLEAGMDLNKCLEHILRTTFPRHTAGAIRHSVMNLKKYPCLQR